MIILKRGNLNNKMVKSQNRKRMIKSQKKMMLSKQSQKRKSNGKV